MWLASGVARSCVAWLAGAALATWAARANATYSIVAADTRTHATGGAGTSCVSGADVYMIYGGVPGVGTLHTQALFDQTTHDEGVRLLASGASPSDVIAALTAPSFDDGASQRQYGAVDVTGRFAAFTGADDSAYAGDHQGRAGDIVYSVQGNILTSRAVIDHAASAFEASGCDLPARLMLALEAGARDGEGDRRCTESRGTPSDSAFLEVELPDSAAGSYLELRVPTSGMDNPLPELRAAFDAWRSNHPCPKTGSSDGGMLGATDGSAAAPAGGHGAGAAGGCACSLPTGRGRKTGVLCLAAVVLAARRPHRPWRRTRR